MTLSSFRLTETLSALQALCHQLHAWLPRLYLLYALPCIVLTTLITPPFQVPDEPHHFCRAEQISRGEIVASFYTLGPKAATAASESVLIPDNGGFVVDKGLVNFTAICLTISPRKKVRVRRSQLDTAQQVHWASEQAYINFSNTAVYPPTSYFVAATGIAVGKLTNASVMDSFYVARFFNGLFCILVCFYALQLTKASRLLLFTVLLFPMTCTLFASVSQDGILISLAFLLFALIGHVESSEAKQYSLQQLIIMVTALVALSTARPPYFILTFLLFFLHLSRRDKLICFSTTLLLVTLWAWLNRHNYSVVSAPAVLRINPALQVQHILADPPGFAGLFFQVSGPYVKDIATEFIGVLGWKDIYLPDLFYQGAFFALVGAVVVSMYYRVRERLRLRSALLAAAVAAGIALIIVQYITWMPLAAPRLGGVQGRYFIPLFAAVALALAGFQKSITLKKWQAPLFLGIVAFPFFTGIVLVCKLIGGYYLAE